jgi:hypothetical protein
MVVGQTVCLRRLAQGSHTDEIRFGRFLGNASVTTEALIAGWSDQVPATVAGRHVLVLQDTTEIMFSTTPERQRGLGKVKKGGSCRGVLLHPELTVDAESGAVLGLAGGRVWTRSDKPLTAHSDRPLHEKESDRWLDGVRAAGGVLSTAAKVTSVGDREGDGFAKWASVPRNGRVHMLTRAMHDHRLASGGLLSAAVASAAIQDRRAVDIVERDRRPARTAELALRFGEVALARPRKKGCAGLPASVALSFVEVAEIDPPEGVEPVKWLLLTTHEIDDVEMAWRVVGWYKRRWLIEQYFRILKTQGFRIEDSQLHTAERLTKLVAIAAKAAVIVMQLTQARDGRDDQPASNAFNDAEIEALSALERRLREKTPRRINRHTPRSLAWAAWIIARLGGWNGYTSAKAKPPGPITFYNGLAYFRACADGWALRDVYMP